MKERMANLWRLMKGVMITKFDQGIFIFQFYHKLDLKRITRMTHGISTTTFTNSNDGGLQEAVGVQEGNARPTRNKRSPAYWKDYVRT